MSSFYLLFFIVIGLLLLPFLVVFLIFNLFTAGLVQLGMSPGLGLLVVLLMLFGSFINIPLGKKKVVKVEDRRFFGALKRKRATNGRISINLGGAVIPLFIVAYLVFQVPLPAALISTLVVTLVSYKISKFIPGLGIAMPVIFPVLTAVLISLLLAPENPEAVAFVSGVLGVIIGGDLLHLPKVLRHSRGVMSIGGAGVFDGIFMVGIISALLAGL